MDISIRVIDKKSDDMIQVKRLYGEVFNDTEGFMEYFFTHEAVLETTVILGAFIDSDIVSLMFLREKSLICDGERTKGCYIYGVATAPGHRGKGYMGRLIAYGLNYCRDNNYKVVYLIPVDEKIYERFGFVSVRKGEKTEEAENPQLMIAELRIAESFFDIKKIECKDEKSIQEASEFSVRTDLMKNGVAIEKDQAYFISRLLQAETEGAGIYIVRDKSETSGEGQIRAVVITAAEEDNGKICISEVICQGGRSEEGIYIRELIKKYKEIKPYTLRHPVMIYKWDRGDVEVRINDQV